MAPQSKDAVGVFASREHTESALDKLKATDFPMDNVSVVTQHLDPEDKALETATPNVQSQAQLTGQQTVERIGEGALKGGSMGGAAGLLLSGLAILAVPGLGSIAVAGMGLATGAFYGALSGGLITTGIDNEVTADRLKPYLERLAQGQYLVVVNGCGNRSSWRGAASGGDSGLEDFRATCLNYQLWVGSSPTRTMTLLELSPVDRLVQSYG
jgi:hypothetical protein